MGALHRAADWIRRALQANDGSLPGAENGVSAKTYDPELLSILSDDLCERVAGLRSAMRVIDSNGDGAGAECYKNCLTEIEKIEELIDGLSALAASPKGAFEPQQIDLTEAFRRALARHEERYGGRLPARIRGASQTPRVIANYPALIRTLALCFDVTELTASPGSTLIVDVEPDEGFVIINFRPTVVTSLMPPRQRERMLSMLGLASRLADSFGARLDVVARDSALTPTLKINGAS